MDDKMFELNIFEENKEEKKEKRNYMTLEEILPKYAHLMNSPFTGQPLGPIGCVMPPLKRPKVKGTPIFGTGLCIVKRNGKYFCERSDDNTDDDIEDSESDIDWHKFILESMDNDEIEDMIYRFGEKYNIKTAIVEPGSSLYEGMKNRNIIFNTIEMNQLNKEQWENTGDIEKIYLNNTSDEYLIVCALATIHDILRKPGTIKRLLLHEYGHAKTMKYINENEWAEYSFKARFILSIPELYKTIKGREYQELLWIYNATYYNLKPERMANEYSKIDYRDLVKDLSGFYPPDNWKQHRFASIISYPIPKDIMPYIKEITNYK